VKWLLEKLKKLINIVDNPIDNLKHWLWSDTEIKNGWYLRIRVPMKNKSYYGFEITIHRKE
jgi:hypothetical protein